MRRKGTLYFRGKYGEKISFKITEYSEYVDNLKYGKKLHLKIYKQ